MQRRRELAALRRRASRLELVGVLVCLAGTVPCGELHASGREPAPGREATAGTGHTGSEETTRKQGPALLRKLRATTQGALWPPSDIVDENGDYVVVGSVLRQGKSGAVTASATAGVLVSRRTVPPLNTEGREDFSDPLGAPYRVLRKLDLRRGGRDSGMILHANSYGPPQGDFGGAGRIPREGDGAYNLNSLGLVCSDVFPSAAQAHRFTRARFPLHKVPVASFRGDGLQYDVDTGQPFVPVLRSGSECFPSGCPGEDPTSYRDTTPITLQRWLAAEGTVKIRLVDYDSAQRAYTRARFEFALENLLPNSVYTFWAIRANASQGHLPDPIAIPNMQRSDETGRIRASYTEENPFPRPGDADAGNRIVGIRVAYQADFQNWGACTSRLGPGVDAMTVLSAGGEHTGELTHFATKPPNPEQVIEVLRRQAERVRRGAKPLPPEDDEFFAVRKGDGPSRIFELASATQGAIYPPAVILDPAGDFPVVGFIPTVVTPGTVVPLQGAALVSRDTVPPLDAEGREDYRDLFAAPFRIVHPLKLTPGSADLAIELWNSSHGPVKGDFGGGIRIGKPGDTLYNMNQAIPGEEACPELFPSSSQRNGHWTRERYPLTQVPIYGFQGDQLAIDAETGAVIPRQEARVDTRPRFEPVTLGDYLAVKGDKVLKVTLTRFSEEVGAYTAARFDVRLRGHVPRNVFHISLLRAQLINPRPLRGNPTSLSVANAFATDENGDAYFSAEIPHPFPDPTTDDAGLRVLGLVGAHHQDHLNKGGCPGIFGSAVDSGTFFNTIFQLGLPGDESPFGLVDFITKPAPPNTPGFISLPTPAPEAARLDP